VIFEVMREQDIYKVVQLIMVGIYVLELGRLTTKDCIPNFAVSVADDLSGLLGHSL